ncbi:hypothetical protein GUI04_14630, partial [Xanthomonas citri pv. citri]|nr:hypothetical protein [Xanthomonas citri pv. citri]
GLVGDQDVVRSEIRCDDNVLSYDDHINQQDQADETFDSISDHLEHNIDQENQESENEQVVQKLDVDENIEARHEDIQEPNMEELEENVDVELEYQEHEETEPETEEHKLDEQEHEGMKPYEHEETDIEEEEREETKPDEDTQTEADDVEV